MLKFLPRMTRLVRSSHLPCTSGHSCYFEAIKRSLQARLQELEITSSSTATIHSGECLADLF